MSEELNWLDPNANRKSDRQHALYDLWRAVAHEQDQRERTRCYGRQN